MESQSQDRWTGSDAVAITGPAVSPRRPPRAVSVPRLGEPLPPFSRPRTAASEAESARAAKDTEHAAPPVLEPEVLDLVDAEFEGLPPEPSRPEPGAAEAGGDLPWLTEELAPSARDEDDLGLVRGADWGFSDDDFEVEITDLFFEEEAPAEPELPREDAPEPPQEVEEFAAQDPSATPLEAAAPREQADWALVASAGPAAESAVGEEIEAPAEGGLTTEAEAAVPSDAAPGVVQRMESALADVMGSGEGEVLEEVAGRLERIALALREGRPVELFASGASDPLEVLIAGYALGYSEAFRRVGEERRGGR